MRKIFTQARQATAALTILSLVTIIFTSSSVKASEENTISLTASDGTGLELTELKVRAVVDGMTAFTEVEMTFYNPENRTREGRFSIILPPNAAISRFAMKMNDTYWQEGEIVETQKARHTYEDFLHRKQDPALLEQDSGNSFRARVFPIPANSEKKLIVSYSELLVNNHSTYTFPLTGLAQLGKLDIKVFYKDKAGIETRGPEATSSLGGEVKEWKIMSVSKEDYKPTEDFTLSSPWANKDIYALREGNVAAVKFVPIPADQSTKQETINKWVVLVDTSASQGLDYQPHIDRVGEILSKIIEQAKPEEIQVLAFDQDLTSVGTIKQKDELAAVIESLKNRLPLGATDYQNAIDRLSGLTQKENSRLLIISDGVATAFETSANELKSQLSQNTKIQRVDTLSLSTYRNEKMLKQLSLAGTKSGVVLNRKLQNETIVNKLLNQTIAQIELKVPDAEWYWPKKAESLQPGDEVVMFAEIKEDRPFSIEYNGKTHVFEPDRTEPLLLKREWVKARLARLLWKEETAEDKDMKNAFHNEVIRLSETERVLSPYTSLLILETEQDYRRYNIDRNALSGILTVGADGIEVIERKPQDIHVPQPPEIVRPVPRRQELIDEETKEENLPFIQMFKSAVSRSLQARTRNASDDIGDQYEPYYLSAETTLDEESVTMTGASSEVLPQSAPLERDKAQGRVDPMPTEPIEPIIIEPPVEPQKPIPVETTPVDGSREVKDGKKPWTGKYAQAHKILKEQGAEEAKSFVLKWYQDSPGDALALIALGEVEVKLGDYDEAKRAYGSLIDLFPSRADIRRWAAERLMQIQESIALTIDTLVKAKEQRPDHPTVYNLLAYAYVSNGEVEKAINVLTEGLNQKFPDRYPEVKRILRENIGLFLSSTIGEHLKENEQVKKVIKQYHIKTNLPAQIRFLMSWETDANDVDFHIYDNKNNHAYYQQMNLKSGGRLYADITQGYGPECFTIENPQAYPYKLQAHYYSRGPMGYGMGMVQIVRLLENKKLSIENRPFIIMQDQAFINIGLVK